jgi:hypothetical protein
MMKTMFMNCIIKAAALLLLVSGEANAITRLANVALIRGGALCVDNEGNFFSPPPAAQSRTNEDVVECDVDNQRSATVSVDSPTFVRGGVLKKNDRFGGLCVDDDGNFYSAPTLSTTNAAMFIRGGELCVDNEGNFYSPRITPVVSSSSPGVGSNIPRGGRRGAVAYEDGQQLQFDQIVLASKIKKKKNKQHGIKKNPVDMKPSVEGAAFVHK